MVSYSFVPLNLVILPLPLHPPQVICFSTVTSSPLLLLEDDDFEELPLLLVEELVFVVPTLFLEELLDDPPSLLKSVDLGFGLALASLSSDCLNLSSVSALFV